MTELKKYEFTGETLEYGGKTLRRIRAIQDFGNVKSGDLGGWIESEKNLSHSGKAWVYDDAKIKSKHDYFRDCSTEIAVFTLPLRRGAIGSFGDAEANANREACPTPPDT